MPNRYPRELRRHVCERLLAGERVEDVAVDVGRSSSTFYLWKRQALIDAGRKEGTKSFEAAEFARAHQRIAELEDELEITRAAAALFNGEETVGPKGGARLPRR